MAHLVIFKVLVFLIGFEQIWCKGHHDHERKHQVHHHTDTAEMHQDIKHIIKKLDNLEDRLHKLERNVHQCKAGSAESTTSYDQMLGDQPLSLQTCEDLSNKLDEYMQQLTGELDEKFRHGSGTIGFKTSAFSSMGQKCISQPKNCAEIYESGRTESGVYTILIPPEMTPLKVSCDMDPKEGGWTIIQRRFDGSINFTRSWFDYSKGFGEIDGEYWLGNTYLNLLTKTTSYKLKVTLEDFDGQLAVAEYSNFKVESEDHDFLLTLTDYWGTAGDAFNGRRGYLISDGMRFSTFDRDNDKSLENLAEMYNGGWWYNQHTFSTVNGIYSGSPDYSRDMQAMIWFTWRGYHGLKAVEMKIKPALCPCT